MPTVEAYWASLSGAPGARRSACGRVARVSSALAWALAIGLIAVAIAALALRVAGVRPLTILSGSMQPALQRGDLVLVTTERARAAKPGQIVTYADPRGRSAPITHRVVRVDRGGGIPPGWLAFTTRGDANRASERWLIPANGSVGRVRARIPAIGAALAPGPQRGLIVAGTTLAALALTLWAIWRRPVGR